MNLCQQTLCPFPPAELGHSLALQILGHRSCLIGVLGLVFFTFFGRVLALQFYRTPIWEYHTLTHTPPIHKHSHTNTHCRLLWTHKHSPILDYSRLYDRCPGKFTPIWRLKSVWILRTQIVKAYSRLRSVSCVTLRRCKNDMDTDRTIEETAPVCSKTPVCSFFHFYYFLTLSNLQFHS